MVMMALPAPRGYCLAVSSWLANLIVVSSLSLACVGCVAIPGSGGATHYLVLGVGLISVSDPQKKEAAVVTDTRALGLVLSDRPGPKLSLGYLSSTVTTIPRDVEHVLIEVKKTGLGPLVIEARSSRTMTREGSR